MKETLLEEAAKLTASLMTEKGLPYLTAAHTALDELGIANEKNVHKPGYPRGYYISQLPRHM